MEQVGLAESQNDVVFVDVLVCLVLDRLVDLFILILNLLKVSHHEVLELLVAALHSLLLLQLFLVLHRIAWVVHHRHALR